MLPDIPTFKEAGYPDLIADVVYFLLAAKGTPQPIVDKLSQRDRQGAGESQGIEEKRGTPPEVGGCLAGEVRRWGDIVKLSATPGLGK